MKKAILVSCIILSFFIYSQGHTILPPSAGKAVVYFVRPSMLGFAINFTYLASANLIGKFNGLKYIRYECEPG